MGGNSNIFKHTVKKCNDMGSNSISLYKNIQYSLYLNDFCLS